MHDTFSKETSFCRPIGTGTAVGSKPGPYRSLYFVKIDFFSAAVSLSLHSATNFTRLSDNELRNEGGKKIKFRTVNS